MVARIGLKASGTLIALITALVLALSGTATAATAYGPVSVADDGTLANASSGVGDYWPVAVSADGTNVAFLSYATNLVSGVTPVGDQVFMRSRSAGTTQLVSVGNHGQQLDADVLRFRLSPNGQYLAFETAASNVTANQPSSDTQHCCPLLVGEASRSWCAT